MEGIYHHARFHISANHLKQLPDDADKEIAFVGRSNAGKSSALNVLCGQKQLARTAKTPGRTQMINYFSLPLPRLYLVDLPGYGYAQVSERVQQHWKSLLNRYILEREQLCLVVLLMDIRHPFKDNDLLMLDACQQRQLPCHVLLTKADKLKFGAQKSTLTQTAKYLEQYHPQCGLQLFSSTSRLGLNELRATLNHFFQILEE